MEIKFKQNVMEKSMNFDFLQMSLAFLLRLSWNTLKMDIKSHEKVMEFHSQITV